MKSILFIHLFVALTLNILAADRSSMVPDAASISGFVKDSTNLETLIGASIFLENTKYGAFTNRNGYFSITNINPGKYKLTVSYIGFKKFSKDISLSKNQNFRLDILLASEEVTTREIEVSALREIERREISISKIEVPVKQIKNIRIGGESDVFRSLQYLPGVLTSSQLSSGLFIRGGSPDQNLVLIDGATVYNPSHLFGFISTFNSDAIKDVQLIKGGFSSEYGGRLSAVVDLTQRDGNRNEIEGVSSLGLISSRLSLNGPLGNGSWFIGGRRTYLEVIKLFLPQSMADDFPDFSFYDLNGKITQFFGDNDKVSLAGFMSNDGLAFDNFGFKLDLDVGNQTVSGAWNHIFSQKLFSELHLSTSYYKNNFKGDQAGFGFEIKNSIRDYSTKGILDWFVDEDITIKTGFEINQYDFVYFSNFTGNLDTNVSAGTNEPGLLNLNLIDWNYAAFAQTNLALTNLLSVQAGLRLNYWDLSSNLMLDPRLSARYILDEKFIIKAAWGIFSQDLRLATQPDFSFFDTWLPTDKSVKPSRAYHYILSAETTLMDILDINFDIYYKRLKNISEINNNTLQTNNIASLFFLGDADAYGGEIFVQKKYGKFAGWIGYAFGVIEAKFDSINNGQSFRPKYDRRHDFKIVAQYELNESWSLNATFLFQSGQSYTGASSQFQARLPGDNIGSGKIYPTQRYGLRLPPSHQLNISAVYSFNMFGLKSKAVLDIYNVYNRRDIWFRFYDTSESVTKVRDVLLLPILPTVSLEVFF